MYHFLLSNAMRLCTLDNCLNKHMAKGLCRKHYARMKRNTPEITWSDLSMQERFLRKTKKNIETGCIEWIGYKNSDGYGTFRNNGKMIKAHRFAYIQRFSEIPKKKCVCHKCDNPSCVNVEHLFLGTHEENMVDRGIKGRMIPPPCGKDNWGAILTESQVIKIRELINIGMKPKNIRETFNIAKTTFYDIKKRRTWKNIP